ncbi:MAG: DUF4157 domain-containing protein [Desulfobacteraceae bacterium]|nr:DUF4157 domain-containing protein [Desulfobacteraceae bacterium]
MSFHLIDKKHKHKNAKSLNTSDVLRRKNDSSHQTLNSDKNTQFSRNQNVFQSKKTIQIGKINAPSVVKDVIQSEGKTLDTNTRASMGSRFGQDFSLVRVHTNAKAAESAKSLDARAYTVGNHIAFDTGEYKPTTLIGEALIAHELAHVVQQKNVKNGQLKASQQLETSLETEANEAALDVVANRLGHSKSSILGFKNSFSTGIRTGLHLQRCARGASKEMSDKEKFEVTKRKLSEAEKGFKIASKALSNKEAAKKASKVADTLGKANKAIDTIEKGTVIFEGIKNLKDLSDSDPYKDPEKFAKEAGETLASLGKVMTYSKIPGVSAYGEFLSKAGDFFVNMRKALDPSIRWRKQFEEIERESATTKKRGAN